MTSRQFNKIKAVVFLLIGFTFIFAEQLNASTSPYFHIPAPVSTDTTVPDVVAPTISPQIASDCTGAVSARFGPGFNLSMDYYDEDCEIRLTDQELTERAVELARAKAALEAAIYHPAYQEQKEEKFFRETMIKWGFASYQGEWKVPSFMDEFFSDNPTAGITVFYLIFAAVILLLIFAFLWAMRAITKPRIKVGEDRSTNQPRKHM